MSDYDTGDKPAPKLSKDQQDTIIKDARDQYDRAMQKEQDNITAAYEDLAFMAGSQWPAEILKERRDEGRPVLTINRLPQFVHQVTGDIRQMRPAIKVVPVDDGADVQVADKMGGLIRYIENRSDAAGIYFQAADQQVSAGMGHWRVCTEYADDSTFNQEIRIEAVDDGIAVLWDADARALTREDAKHCFVPVDMTTAAFKEKYPDASVADFETLKDWAHVNDWVTDDHVRVCEYWRKEPSSRTLAMTQDGQILDLTDGDEKLGLSKDECVSLATKNGARIEERESYKIVRYVISATEILEGPVEWMGRYIPIVPVVGEEVRIGRKTIRKGIIRDAKDAQRMFNYFRSAQTEVVALQPKAPFMVTETNVAKYQDVWDTANVKNFPYLPYEPDTKNGGQAPQRVQPAVSSQGINEGVIQANQDMMAVIGIYDASLGNKSNETSGVAIQARQREGDNGTYVYLSNFTRAVRQTGKILIDLIPHVYDTQRTIRIMGEDGALDTLTINQERDHAGLPIIDPKTGQPTTLNDVTVGAYDVVAEEGASYSTKREEARDGMLEMLRAVPQLAPLMIDKIVKAQDWPMANEIAARARATIPPQILQAEELEKKGVPPDQIQQMMAQQQAQQQQQGPPPDPHKVAQAQREQLGAQHDAEKHQVSMQQSQIALASTQQEAQGKAQLQQLQIAIAAEKLRKLQQSDPAPAGQ